MNKATLARIVSLLHELGPMPFAAIMHTIGLEEAALDDMLDALVAAGIVGELPDGRFVLTDWARERLERPRTKAMCDSWGIWLTSIAVEV